MQFTKDKQLAFVRASQDGDEIDASVVAFTPETPLIDERWVIVLDPRAIDTNDIAIRMTVADLVRDSDEDEAGEAE